jgi:hypothetical protein
MTRTGKGLEQEARRTALDIYFLNEGLDSVAPRKMTAG